MKSDPRKYDIKGIKPTELENALSTMAYHTGLIMTEKAPKVISIGLAGPNKKIALTVTIEPGTDDKDNVWDQTYVKLKGEEGKGDWAGNRCGARNVIAHLYADIIKDIALNGNNEKKIASIYESDTNVF